MENNENMRYINEFRERMEERVVEFIEDIRLSDPDASDEVIMETGKLFVEFGNAIIAKLN